MTALVPRSGGDIAAAPGTAVEVEYLSDCGWGTWTCLPQVIRDRVRPLLDGEELACWVGESVVLRRGESHSEERKAWWGSDRVLLQARRGPSKREECLPDQPWRTRLVDTAVVESTMYDLGEKQVPGLRQGNAPGVYKGLR